LGIVLFLDLLESSEFKKRKAEIDEFNKVRYKRYLTFWIGTKIEQRGTLHKAKLCKEDNVTKFTSIPWKYGIFIFTRFEITYWEQR